MSGMEEEIEAFIQEGGLDEHAAGVFRQLDPELQIEVMSAGSVAEAKNPSAACLGRIKQARGRLGAGKSSFATQDGAATPEEVEDFILDGQLDERAATALRELGPGLQHAVLAAGSVSNARNPSAACLGRIRDAQSGKGKGSGKANGSRHSANDIPLGGYGGNDAEAELEHTIRLDTFIIDCGLDERSEAALREEPRHVQQAVMDRGSTTTCRNPAAVIMSRIRDAQSSGAASPRGGGGSQTVYRPRGGGGGHGVQAHDLEWFITESGCDERAARVLSELFDSGRQDVLQAVVEQGVPSASCNNPSAMILGRVRDAQKGGGGAAPMGGGGKGGGGGGYMGGKSAPRLRMSDIENFIAEFTLDDRASSALLEAGPEVQQFVLSKGSLRECRNPSAVVLARIRDGKQNSGGGGGGYDYGGYEPPARSAPPARAAYGTYGAARGNAWQVESFIRDNGLDDRAGKALRELTPEQQSMVMDRGPLSDCRNASGACMGRIRDAQSKAPAGGSPYGGGGGGGGSLMRVASSSAYVLAPVPYRNLPRPLVVSARLSC
eukprot:gnl/MRDRNA2_/MRDRNA2_27838_c0_seq1.p1 gnl/MRDRNA2_/MRDRNA2_27838_c0~~gnl/MRDRNA2_/MRDRNA2_27838_c0_seq1.p1  ORF type:complete len:549 (+),score=119.36 gnl/MRDRNA2_/MRDRNA2_27838_c0_seq1:122-1768(+)